MGAVASIVDLVERSVVIRNLYSQLPLRSLKHRERLYLPNNGAWLLFVGCYSTEVLMLDWNHKAVLNVRGGAEWAGGAECAGRC